MCHRDPVSMLSMACRVNCSRFFNGMLVDLAVVCAGRLVQVACCCCICAGSKMPFQVLHMIWWLTPWGVTMSSGGRCTPAHMRIHMCTHMHALQVTFVELFQPTHWCLLTAHYGHALHRYSYCHCAVLPATAARAFCLCMCLFCICTFSIKLLKPGSQGGHFAHILNSGFASQ